MIDEREIVDQAAYGISMTSDVHRELRRMSPERQRSWMADMQACGAWWLWELKHRPPRLKKAHIARKWHSSSSLIGTLCSQQFHREDMSKVDPNYPDVVVCGTCQRVATKNGIEIGNFQPRLR